MSLQEVLPLTIISSRPIHSLLRWASDPCCANLKHVSVSVVSQSSLANCCSNCHLLAKQINPHNVSSYLFANWVGQLASHSILGQDWKFIYSGSIGSASLEYLMPTHHTKYPIPGTMMQHEYSRSVRVVMLHHEYP